jgi:glycosyltransferase involved in cell wall biosynthesis
VKSKINLLHLITGLGCGGAEKMVYQLCKYSDKTQFNISVVSIDDTDYFFSKLKKLQIKVSKLGLKKNPITFLNGILSLNKFIRKYKIQIIHAHLFHAMMMSCVMKLLNPKLKIIWTGHNSRMISLWRSLIAFLTRRIRTHDIHLQTHLQAWYNAICSSTIPNGIEFPKIIENNQKFKEFTFISVGSLEEQKNHIFLIELFSKIDNYKLLIVGSGPEEKAIQNRINELGLMDNITLLGHRDDVYRLMQKSHCLLFPSLWEGLPLVVLESAYVKLPIITSSIISMKKLISDDEGYVVPFNEFERAIYSVVNNYADAEEKANRFYKRVKNDFDILACTRNHEHLYRFLLNV